jgi:uncharacterized RDD family membrane protein YckC
MESKNMCPLCDVELAAQTPIRQIYGLQVCASCHDDFAFRRGLAFFLDAMASNVVIMPAILLGFLLFGTDMPVRARSFEQNLFVRSLTIVVLVAVPALLILLKEGFGGSSPGKALFGLKVINTSSGQTCSFASSMKRTLPLFVPFMPIYVAYQLFRSDGRRLGDVWAGTKVISKQQRTKAPFCSQVSTRERNGYVRRGLHGAGLSQVCTRCVRDAHLDDSTVELL